MKRKQHFEPLFWALFGLGGVTAAILIPPIIIILGIGMPLGLIDPSIFSYENIIPLLFDNILITLLIAAALIPTYWHCLHRFFHSLHDINLPSNAYVKFCCYGFAALISTVTFIIIVIFLTYVK